MTDEIFRAKALFRELLSLSPDVRPDALAERCGGNAHLRALLERMLAADDGGMGSFLEPDGPTAPTPTVRPRDHIGQYRVLRQLGEGGMGTVFLAEQREPIRRRVAVKLIKAGLDSPEVLARFDAERQALALMDHPNIAKVFDAGVSDSDRPYVVMEYVPGVPIQAFCDREELPTRERLELFVQVCDAVQHAHQRGVIHRDLKPSNVLVEMRDGRAVPRVIDFGVAKAISQPLTDRTLFTEQGQLVGTLEYMSPEQMEISQQGIDTRTDIYALGVILYELLIGTRPFDRSTLLREGLLGMKRLLLESTPPKPSTRLQSTTNAGEVARRRKTDLSTLRVYLKGDLDWITMKALDKERGRRYASASEFASDVERFLRNQPVTARPPSIGYHLRKFIARHPGVSILVSTLLVVIVTSVAVLSWLYGAQRRERTRADLERDRAVAESEKANELSDYLQDVLAAATPLRTGRPDIQVREVLAEASETAKQSLAVRPEIRGAIEYTIAKAYFGLGLFEDAAKHAESSLAIREQALPEGDPDLASSVDLLGNVQAERGENDIAARLLERAIRLREDAFGPESAEVAESMEALANAMWNAGEREEGMATAERVLAMRRRAFGDRNIAVASSLVQVGRMHSRRGDYDRARQLLTEARLIYAATGSEYAVTEVTGLLGWILADLGDREQAEAMLRETLDTRLRILGEDHPWTAMARNNLGNLLLRFGEWEKAKIELQHALETHERYYGREHKETADVMTNLAAAYQCNGELEEAEPRYRAALDIRVATLGEDHPDLVHSYQNLGQTLYEMGRFEEANAMFHKSYDSMRHHSSEKNPAIGFALGGIGRTLVSMGRAREAEPVLREAVALWRESVPAGDWRIAALTSDLGECLVAQARYEEAEPLLKAGKDGLLSAPGPTDRRMRDSILRLVHLYEAWGDSTAAATYAEELRRFDSSRT